MNYLKYKDRFLPSMAMHWRVKGEFRCVLKTESGIVIEDTGWFENMFLDNGIMNVGHSNWCSYIEVGGGTTPPQATDLQLESLLGYATASLYGEANGGTPNYEVITTMKARFNAGNATGTINELGIRKSSTFYGGNLDLSFRTILPSPVEKTANQVLDVFWKLTVFPDLSEPSGQLMWGTDTYNWRSAPGYMQVGNNLTWTAWGSPAWYAFYDEGATIDTGIEARPSGSSSGYTGTGQTIIEHTPGYKKQRFSIPLQSSEKRVQAAHYAMTACRTSQKDPGLKVLFERESDNAPLILLPTEVGHMDILFTWGRL